MSDGCDRQVTLLLNQHGGPGSAYPSLWQLTPKIAFWLIVAADSIADLDDEGCDRGRIPTHTQPIVPQLTAGAMTMVE